MRKQFFKCLDDIASRDKSVVFLTGDLGFSFMEDFQKKYPKQFINCGCIEQSMIGIAAGLAKGGKKPYCYSTIPFLLFRAYEQVRDDVCYNNANVKLIGVSMSGFIGFTHEIAPDEDLKVLDGLPNIECYFPQNKNDLAQAMEVCYERGTPAYIRI